MISFVHAEFACSMELPGRRPADAQETKRGLPWVGSLWGHISFKSVESNLYFFFVFKFKMTSLNYKPKLWIGMKVKKRKSLSQMLKGLI